MNPTIQGLYATRVYLPFSLLARRWRLFSRRVRGKSDRFMQTTRLSEAAWTSVAAGATPRIWDHKKRNGNVRVSELAILSALASKCADGSNLFEIGTFDGRTTLNLAMSAPLNCQVHTLDLPPAEATAFALAEGERHMVDKPTPGVRYRDNARSHPAQMHRIHQHLGDSATFDYEPFTASCSLVFVDGSHAYDYAISDTRAARRLLAPGGVIVWHDYGVWEGVTRALEEIESRERLGIKAIRGTSLACWRSGWSRPKTPGAAAPATT